MLSARESLTRSQSGGGVFEHSENADLKMPVYQPMHRSNSLGLTSLCLEDGSINFVDFLKSKDNYNCFLQEGESEKMKLDFENWFIKKLIGKGAYGKVYLITHRYEKDCKQISKDYALKCYKKDLLVEHDMADSTIRETDALLQLEHPFILNLHFSFQTPSRHYFVLDLVSGGDLF
jgi:hypothetical protein